MDILNIAFQKKFDKNIDIFSAVMHSLVNIRNRCCHNNVVYNIQINKDSHSLKKFLYTFFENFNNNIRLLEIVKIIDCLNSFGSSTESLQTIIKEKINSKISKSDKIPDESKEFIYKKMNYIPC